jgi:hypothetical protein
MLYKIYKGITITYISVFVLFIILILVGLYRFSFDYQKPLMLTFSCLTILICLILLRFIKDSNSILKKLIIIGTGGLMLYIIIGTSYNIIYKLTL